MTHGIKISSMTRAPGPVPLAAAPEAQQGEALLERLRRVLLKDLARGWGGLGLGGVGWGVGGVGLGWVGLGWVGRWGGEGGEGGGRGRGWGGGSEPGGLEVRRLSGPSINKGHLKRSHRSRASRNTAKNTGVLLRKPMSLVSLEANVLWTRFQMQGSNDLFPFEQCRDSPVEPSKYGVETGRFAQQVGI